LDEPLSLVGLSQALIVGQMGNSVFVEEVDQALDAVSGLLLVMDL